MLPIYMPLVHHPERGEKANLSGAETKSSRAGN
jgi:hypothetical protein